MSKRKQTESKVVHPSNLQSPPSADGPAPIDVNVAPERTSQSYLAAQVNATIMGWEQSLNLRPLSLVSDHNAMMKRTRWITAAVVEAIASVATNHGGAIHGIPFDADRAREIIAYRAAMETVAALAERFAQHLRDDALQRYDEMAMEVTAAYDVMKRKRRSAAGRAIEGDFRNVQAVVRSARPRRQPRKKTDASQSSKPAETSKDAPSAPAGASTSTSPSSTSGTAASSKEVQPTTTP